MGLGQEEMVIDGSECLAVVFSDNRYKLFLVQSTSPAIFGSKNEENSISGFVETRVDSTRRHCTRRLYLIIYQPLVDFRQGRQDGSSCLFPLLFL